VLAYVAHGLLGKAADAHGARGKGKDMPLAELYPPESGLEFFFEFLPLGTLPTDS
jgi:hypothetical protein